MQVGELKARPISGSQLQSMCPWSTSVFPSLPQLTTFTKSSTELFLLVLPTGLSSSHQGVLAQGKHWHTSVAQGQPLGHGPLHLPWLLTDREELVLRTDLRLWLKAPNGLQSPLQDPELHTQNVWVAQRQAWLWFKTLRIFTSEIKDWGTGNPQTWYWMIKASRDNAWCCELECLFYVYNILKNSKA